MRGFLDRLTLSNENENRCASSFDKTGGNRDFVTISRQIWICIIMSITKSA